jgi:hypothetical protein
MAIIQGKTKTDGWPQNFKKSDLDAILRDETPNPVANTPVKTFRLDPELVKELEREAKSQHRTLSNYVSFLLSTHPDRKIRKK